jgi:hypothetical protein
MRRRERRGPKYASEVLEKLDNLENELHQLLQLEPPEGQLRAYMFKANLIIKYYVKTKTRVVRVGNDQIIWKTSPADKGLGQ